MARQFRHSIAVPGVGSVPAAIKEALIWGALWRSYPEPVCIGTLARVVWPADDLPPTQFIHWQHTIAVHVNRLRRQLRGSEFAITERQGFRYSLAFGSRAMAPSGVAREGGGGVPPQATPAAHLQPPQQRSDLGQQHGGQECEAETVGKRGCSPAAHQSVSGSQSLHAPQHAEEFSS